MSHHIVTLENLVYNYPDGTRALQSISFTIRHGESVAVVGANGAGKSTLLQHLNGYLTPTHGRVCIDDTPLTGERLKGVRRTIGMVFQDPDDQLFMPTVAEDVAFGPLNLGLAEEEIDRRVDEALADVGAQHLKERPPHHLSGGEKRSVAIATVLAMHPNVLVLDEPSSGLDPRGRRLLINQLCQFSHTKIIASHDLDLVLDVCERTLVIDGGRLIADGSTAEIFSDRNILAAAGLELPLRLQGCPRCGQSLVEASKDAL